MFSMIRKYSINLSFLILLLPGCPDIEKPKLPNPVKIIFDTDLGSDYDDVGALAFLHAAASCEL